MKNLQKIKKIITTIIKPKGVLDQSKQKSKGLLNMIESNIYIHIYIYIWKKNPESYNWIIKIQWERLENKIINKQYKNTVQ